MDTRARFRNHYLLATLATLILSPLSAFATDAGSGTVGPTTSDSAAWTNSATPVSTGSAACGGASNPSCDNFSLTIVPHVSGNYTVTVALQPIGGDDWDLEVYAPDGTTVLGSSGNSPGAVEVVSLSNPPAGVYTVAAAPFAAAAGYTAIATLATVDPPPPGGAEQVEFYVYVDPGKSQGGEPSGGVDWNAEPADGTVGGDNGGSIMFVSSLTTLRIEHDDCTAPAGYMPGGEWEDISVPFHVVSLDPIGLVDPITGRMFSDQLAVKSSLLGLSDDQGQTWAPSQGAPFNPGVDHQTLGAGRLAEPLFSLLDGNNAAYNNFAHGVWYASQDVALAQAGLSIDGGTTFGAANPMWTLADCSGLHGHLKVSPVDGTLYVPNKSCNGQQGTAISTDNATTWTISRVPNTTAGEWDPSIGVANDGTVYIGMDQGGAPMAAVSLDNGATWSNPIDVSEGIVKTTAFSTMVAGDGDRAAFGFLGTTTPGSLGTDQTNTAVWDLYVSMTFDRGQTWNTVNVTDGDPVQRGVICDQGTTCPSNRNLLDFNDIQMDKRGRPIVFFADGCIDDCVNNPGIVTQARTATIARLKSPKGLLAAYDAERSGVPDWPQARAVPQGSDVLVTWQEPGNGGNPIDFYEIRKDGVLLTTVSPLANAYTDVGGNTGNPYYEVLAHNSAGYSRGPNGTPAPLKASCDNRVFIGAPPPPEGSSLCDFEGLGILDDNASDILTAGNPTAGSPGAASYDLRRLGISQNEDIYGAGNIAFIIDVQSTDVLAPNAYWPLEFNDANNNPMWVRMETVTGGPTAPAFSYGTGSLDPLLNPGTPAEASSRAEGGKIIIVVPLSAVSANVGDTLNSFLIRARINLVAATLTPDNMPDSLAGEGSYQVVKFSSFCAVNLPPLALDDSAVTDACHPVVIDVLGDPSTGDSDPENDELTITGVEGATNGVALIIEDADGQKVEYRPNNGYVGSETLTYTVNDGNGNEASATISVTINATADADADGVMNSCDNCLDVSNADQCNTNSTVDIFGNVCDADLTNDGIVNSFDLSIMRDNFGASGDNDADLDCNGIVNSFDLSIMRDSFGGNPGPSGLPPL